MFDLAIVNGLLVTSETDYKATLGNIGIKDGKIEVITAKELNHNDTKILLNAQGKIVMPGMINCHCHGDMTVARGIGAKMTLREQMGAFEEHSWFYPYLSEDARYHSRMQTYCEALLSGTTVLVENMFWGLGDKSQKAFKRTGLRGAPAEDIRYDFLRSDEFLTDEMLSDFRTNCINNGYIPVLGTLPEEAFTEKRLKETKRVIDSSGCRFTSHLAETNWRYEFVKEAFGKSPVKVLDEYGLLNENYFGSHGVYFDNSDIDILSKRGVTIVNTPICEQKIADGLAPIPKLLAAGVNVSLGTDGAMWNNSNDMFREMKCMGIIHNISSGVKAIGAREVLDMATLNGARTLGLENETGSLKEGKLADIVLVDATGPHMTPLHYGNYDNIAEALVYCATGRDVTEVIAQGEIVVKNGKITTCDLAKIQNEVQSIASELIKKIY